MAENTNTKQQNEEEEEDESTKPDFIYAGPFITHRKPGSFVDSVTPFNTVLQGTYKGSFAYYSLKERMPVILTKVIDQLSKMNDTKEVIECIAKLKSDLMTNKKYELLASETEEAQKWNNWIEGAKSQSYFMNDWVFTECYVYRKLRDCIEMSKSHKNFDPFSAQKMQAFNDSLEPMCVVADKLKEMLGNTEPEEKQERQRKFQTLLKISLWSNKCDLSLSAGAPVSIEGETQSGFSDPFQWIDKFKDKVLVDDSNKINLDFKTKNININDNGSFIEIPKPVPKEKKKGKKGKAAKTEEPKPVEVNPDGEKPPVPEKKVDKVPCPSKVVDITTPIFDIVCDNAGYELFADLCLADFVLTKNIVQYVRFHVKNIPWFVSDVTPDDFKNVIEKCSTAQYKREVEVTTEAGTEKKTLTSEALNELGNKWKKYVDDGKFICMHDDFWTSPHVYKDLRKYDMSLFRKLQFASLILFKGDLNYRKLMGENNWIPTTSFEKALQEFHPAPLIALRTVKADLIAGLPKGKAELLNQKDPKWMETGDYGVIQYCKKKQPIKISETPCADYGNECLGRTCPVHKGLY